MKKFFLICAIISSIFYGKAQDIIALKNGERIENITIQSINNREITYTQSGNTLTIPHNSAQAILYADGRYEELKDTFVSDSASISNTEQLGYDANELQALVDRGEDRKMLLWQDKTYSAACRKAGKKVYSKVFEEIFTSALIDAEKSGMKKTEAIQQAMEKALQPAVKASNEAVRECNGGM